MALVRCLLSVRAVLRWRHNRKYIITQLCLTDVRAASLKFFTPLEPLSVCVCAKPRLWRLLQRSRTIGTIWTRTRNQGHMQLQTQQQRIPSPPPPAADSPRTFWNLEPQPRSDARPWAQSDCPHWRWVRFWNLDLFRVWVWVWVWVSGTEAGGGWERRCRCTSSSPAPSLHSLQKWHSRSSVRARARVSARHFAVFHVSVVVPGFQIANMIRKQRVLKSYWCQGGGHDQQLL